MSDVLMSWPSPDVLERRRRRRLLVSSAVLALVTLLASMALVHGFDAISWNATVARSAAEGSPLYPVGCTACDTGVRLPLPDWRSLSVWAIAMSAAAVSWTAGRRPTWRAPVLPG